MQVLNDDFAAQNTDISNYNALNADCPSTYPASALFDGACLEFCLAQYDHPTDSGIAEGDYAITVGQHSWPSAGSDWAGYMNIFVEDNTGGLGVAPLNGGANPNGNGFQVDASAFGGPGIFCNSGADINTSGSYNLGRTATHEAGHYFDLGHIFNGCNNGDGIADTPDQSQSNFGCPSVNTTTCTSDANNSCSTQDFWFNYMDYVNDACMWMFTTDQATTMYSSADHNFWADHTVKCQLDPNACNLLSANLVVGSCDDSGTPADASDDTYSFTINPSGNNLGATYSLSGDVFGSGFPYGNNLTFDNNGQGYLISDGTLTVTITDIDDPSCTLTFFVNPPMTCASPDASFVPTGNITVCANAPDVVFSDTSDNNPTSWSWSVIGPDATIVSSTNGSFTVAFNTSGTYTVALEASNAYGMDTADATFDVDVLPLSDAACQNCDHTLVLWDRRANGWNNNQEIEVTIDGVVTTYQGPPNGSLSQTVPLTATASEDIQIIVSNGGNTANHMSWRLFDEEGYVLLGGGDSYGIGPGNAQGNNGPTLASATSGTFTTTGDCSSVSPCDGYTLTMELDNYPDETAWQVLDANGDYVYQSPGYENQELETVTESLCLPEGCYDFLIIDYYGDGICCGEGNGSYELVRDSDGAVVASGGEFDGLESSNFCVDLTLPCNITADNLIVSLCDDGGTPSEPMDDTYTFTLNPSGDNLGSTYSVSGDVSGSGYAYGSATTFDNGGLGYVALGGDLTLTIEDDSDPNCTLMVLVTAPETCSTVCSLITANESVGACDDSGTLSDPSDDTYTFVLNPSGMNISGSYSITGDISGSGYPYGLTLFDNGGSGYLISDGDLSITIQDDIDPSCTISVTIEAPTSCSSMCNLAMGNEEVSLCDNAGTPSDPMDDTYTFTLNPSGDNLGSTYSVSGDVSGSGYAYGSATTFDNGGLGYLISGGNLGLIVSDDNSPSCELSITIVPPMSCSDDPGCLDLVTVNDPVGPGDYVADSILTSAGVITNGISVNFFAGDTVYLENNFEVEQGAELLVDIMDCDAYIMNSANASSLYLKSYDGLEMVALLDKDGNVINTILGSESEEQYQQIEMEKLLETGVYFIQYETAEGSTMVKKLFVD